VLDAAYTATVGLTCAASVANHINDVSRTTPGPATEKRRRWLERPEGNNPAAVRYQARAECERLVKAGTPTRSPLLGFCARRPASVLSGTH